MEVPCEGPLVDPPPAVGGPLMLNEQLPESRQTADHAGDVPQSTMPGSVRDDRAGSPCAKREDATPPPVGHWGSLDLELDPTPLRGIRMPHPIECEPRLTPRNPKWEPARRDPRDAGATTRRRPAPDWDSPKLIGAPDAGAVRIGMTWRKSFVTSASFSRKAGRTMYFEGPHEPAAYRLMEIGHRSTDQQWQPLGFVWNKGTARERRYFVDSAEERDDGSLVFRENKASLAYFEDPEIDEKLAAAEQALTRYPGVTFERQLGTELMHPVRWRIAKNIFDDRRVGYSEKQSDAVRELFEREGTSVPLARVWEAIGDRPEDAARIANAMLVRRLVGFPVDRVPSRETVAIRPRPAARPGRLRAFLSSFAPEAGR